jgi:ABC-type polysaccharide/polyol phosphate transport system ATPase subunit
VPAHARPGVALDHVWQFYRPRTRHGGRNRGGEPRWVLEDVCLEAYPGEMLGIVGSNGAGKSTLLRTVAGVLTPAKGTVQTVGAVRFLIDLTAGLGRDLTGYETLLFNGVLLGLRRAEVRSRFDDIGAFAELTETELSSPISTYSDGMRLRLGFSLIVHTDPSVLLVDEVLAVGDEHFQRKCVARVKTMEAAGCTVLLVSHDLELVAEHCDRVAVLDHGRVRHVAHPTEAVPAYLELLGEAPPTGSGRR